MIFEECFCFDSSSHSKEGAQPHSRWLHRRCNSTCSALVNPGSEARRRNRGSSAVRFCVRVCVCAWPGSHAPACPRVNTPWRRAERRRFGVSVGGDRPVGDLRYALSCRPRPLCSRFCGATANPFHRVFLFYIKARRNGSRSSALYVLAPQFVGGAKKLAGMKIRVRRSCSLR